MFPLADYQVLEQRVQRRRTFEDGKWLRHRTPQLGDTAVQWSADTLPGPIIVIHVVQGLPLSPSVGSVPPDAHLL